MEQQRWEVRHKVREVVHDSNAEDPANDLFPCAVANSSKWLGGVDDDF
jgi:hypothetical protein